VPLQIDTVRASAWTVAGSGGTRPTITTQMKKRSSMASSLVAVGDIGIATTGALTAGTKVLETTAMAAILASGPITASLNGTIVTPGTTLRSAEVAHGEHPFVLAVNEGFVVRAVAVPATGTWTFAVCIDWAEVAAY
jgi:hypothetical protein